MTTIRWATFAALCALGLALAGCTNGDPAPTTSTPPASTAPTSSSTTPSPTPTTPTPEEEAVAVAETVTRAYYQAMTSCLADPENTAATCFDDVATATELNNMRNALASAQQMHTKIVGSVEVVSTETVAANLSDEPDATPPVVPEVILRVCRDVSGVDVVDANGESIVPAGRVERGYDDVHVANYSYPDAGQWRVALVEYASEESPC